MYSLTLAASLSGGIAAVVAALLGAYGAALEPPDTSVAPTQVDPEPAGASTPFLWSAEQWQQYARELAAQTHAR